MPPRLWQTRTRTLCAIIDYNVANYAKTKLGDTKRDSLATAAEILGVGYANLSPRSILEQWKEVSDFVDRFEVRYGKDALVRIASSLLWHCYKGGLPYREFCVLCELNSILGKTTRPKRVTQPSIRVRFGGFKSWSVATAEGVCEMLPSRQQIERMLNRLERRGFFARARIGARTVLFKVGVSYEQLCDQIVEDKTGVKLNRSNKDRQLRERIKEGEHINRIEHINSSSNNDPDLENVAKSRALSEYCCENEPENEPEHINYSSLIEALNESSPNESVRNSASAHVSLFPENGERERF